MELCFATNNVYKIKEVQELLGNQYKLLTLKEIGCEEELPEERDSFAGNSLQKAEYVFRKFNLPCFADDSGLGVNALHGAPGVHSAMYAGPGRSNDENMDLLLKNLEGVTDRRAQFITVISWVEPNLVKQFEGIVHGNVLSARRGTGGFGYDPLFVPDGYTSTFAEMSGAEKNKISHRAIAFKKLVAFLQSRNVTAVHE